MLNINKVTILGANGNMGSQCAGLIAALGNAKVYMVARTIDKVNEGIDRACESVKSDAIKSNLIPATYDSLSSCIPLSDWVLESSSEDIEIKHTLNGYISSLVKPKTVISTTSSGLSITALASDFSRNLQSNYFGTHFFNPPYKMLLCEVIPNPNSGKKIQVDLVEYLEKVLLRQVITSKDEPAFVGNRIGIEIINEALRYGKKYGIDYIDYLLGGITGRVMPPLQTIDLIGVDIYKAVAENMGLKIPNSINKLILGGRLGNKSGEGLYKPFKNKIYCLNMNENKYEICRMFNFDLIEDVKMKIREGDYQKAIFLLLSSNTREAKIIQYFFAKYIHSAFSIIGTIAKNSEDIDKAMGFGFNWLPPSSLINLLGGRHMAIDLLNKFNLSIPAKLSSSSQEAVFYKLQDRLDYRSFVRSQ